MKRVYEIHKTETGWELHVWEGRKALAMEVAEDSEEGFAYLLDQAESAHEIKKYSFKPTWWRV